MGTRYYSGGRRRYLWNTAATYRCPNADAPPWALVEVAHEAGVHRLPEMFKAAHQRSSRIRQRDENDRPTDRCSVCGGKLQKVGYRVWVEGRYEDVVEDLRRRASRRGGRQAGKQQILDQVASVEASQRINERLGGDGWTYWPDSERYFGVKREAISWCAEQAEQEKAERAEAART